MTVFSPPKTLQANPQSAEVVDYWQDDGTSYVGLPYTWRVTFQLTNPQLHSDPTTGMVYDGTNVAVGDWFSNKTGGAAWRIDTIESQDSGNVTCIVEDVDQFNSYADSSQSADGSPPLWQTGFIFSLDALNEPITLPLTGQLDPQWQSDLISRFWYTFPGSDSGSGSGPPASNTTPQMDSDTPSAGSNPAYARGDHVHPCDITRLAIAGGTMTGPLILAADPVVTQGAATKHYVDTIIIDGGSF